MRKTAVTSKNGWFSRSSIKVVSDRANKHTIVLIDDSQVNNKPREQHKDTKRKKTKKRSMFMKKVKDLQDLLRKGYRFYLDMLTAVLGVLSCLLYIVGTYLNGLQLVHQVEIFISFYFIVEYLFNYIIADSKYRFFFCWDSFLAIISLFPLAVLLIDVDTVYTQILKSLLLLRLMNMVKLLRYIKDDSLRQVSIIFLQAFTATSTFGEVIRLVENFHRASTLYKGILQPQLDFYDTFYFIIVTVSTVGYGDVSAVSDTGRAIVVIFILSEAYYVPMTIARLTSIFSKKTRYERKRVRNHKGTQSILILGYFEHEDTIDSLEDFLLELFDEDHGFNGMIRAVVMSSASPSASMNNLLQDPHFNYRLEYIAGSPLSNSDLARVGATKMRAIFVLTNKSTSNVYYTDINTLYIAVYLKKYLCEQGALNTILYFQVIQSITDMKWKLRLESQFTDLPQQDEVLVIDKFRFNILAKTVRCPGFVTLLSNFVNSTSAPPSMESSSSNLLNDYDWKNEYRTGEEYEIYHTLLSEAFEGVSFSSAAVEVFRHLEVTMIALDLCTKEKNRNSNNQLVLNPGTFIIPNVKEYNVHAFVLARNKGASDLSSLLESGDDFFSSSLINDKLSLLKRLNKLRAEQFAEYQIAQKNAIVVQEPKCVHNSTLDSYFNIEETLSSKPSSIDSRVLVDISHAPYEINNHIVFIGETRALHHFTNPFLVHSNSDEEKIVIVLLVEDLNKISSTVWSELKCVEDVHIILGDPENEVDLRRAGIESASAVIITPYKSQSFKEGFQPTPIFLPQTIRSLNNKTHIVSEFACKHHMNYILEPSTHHDSLRFTRGEKLTQLRDSSISRIAAGHAYSLSMVDTLLCQMLFNSKLFLLIQALIENPAEETLDLYTVNTGYRKNTNFPTVS